MTAGSHDNVFEEDYLRCTNPDALAAMPAQVCEPAPRLDFRARRSLATDSFEGDLAVLLAALGRIGIHSVAVVDLTQPEIGIPVVKVVVPGLEGLSLTSVY